jgi:ABC-2 type transport system ATP-binding protein
MMARTAIELTDVTRRFGELTAVDGVTLSVGEGEIVGLLGHNGAGKTTMIRVINGLLSPDAGQVRVLGVDPTTDGQVVRRSTGVLTEYPALDEFLTTAENLEVYAAINGIPRRVARERIDGLLDRLGLTEKREEPARGLSAGLKQRVALARALVHDPQVLLLDEPTTNMDPVAARGVRDLIVEASRERGRTVLLSTHNLAEAEQLCDRVAIMRFGRLLTVGAPAELRRSLGGAGGVRIEVADDDTASVIAHVNGTAEATAIDRQTVQVDGRVDIPALVAGLTARGVPIRRVEPIEPTLEDLYVSLHDHGFDRGREVAG